jgi:hypothetical protein
MRTISAFILGQKGILMNSMKIVVLAATAIVALAAAPALAGEVTGTGEQVDSPGRSICKFSGQNDGEPPLGNTQSFGQNVREGRNDPTDFDPDGGFQEHPGWFCNPNNFDARELIPL